MISFVVVASINLSPQTQVYRICDYNQFSGNFKPPFLSGRSITSVTSGFSQLCCTCSLTVFSFLQPEGFTD